MRAPLLPAPSSHDSNHQLLNCLRCQVAETLNGNWLGPEKKFTPTLRVQHNRSSTESAILSNISSHLCALSKALWQAYLSSKMDSHSSKKSRAS